MGYFGLLDNPSFGPQNNLSLRPLLYCHYLATNNFCPTFIVTLLPSIKTVVPIVVNTSLRIQTGEELKVP